jgi:hypothetical protein
MISLLEENTYRSIKKYTQLKPITLFESVCGQELFRQMLW